MRKVGGFISTGGDDPNTNAGMGGRSDGYGRHRDTHHVSSTNHQRSYQLQACSTQPFSGAASGEHQMTKTLNIMSIGVATVGVLCMLQADPAVGQEKHGVIPHAPLLK